MRQQIFLDEFKINRTPPALRQRPQDLAPYLIGDRKKLRLPTKMPQIVCHHTCVEWIKEVTLAVIAINCRHRVPAPYHLIGERNIDLGKSAAVADHLREICQQYTHYGSPI